MSTITTKDGTIIFYKDWGPKDAQPIVFHRGWPLSSDNWDVPMLIFLANGYRVVAHDRRDHGRSSQVDTGNDMDHYASDASAAVEHLEAFSETDQTDDLKAIKVPTLVMQGDDDQIVPYKDAALLQAKLLKHGTLKIYPGFPHGMMTTNADVINADLLSFIRS
jgi:pimeloyl-ACP methyl ester carboxylesterase